MNIHEATEKFLLKSFHLLEVIFSTVISSSCIYWIIYIIDPLAYSGSKRGFQWETNRILLIFFSYGKISWIYNWSPDKMSVGNMEFVLIVWSINKGHDGSQFFHHESCSNILPNFNELERGEQANMRQLMLGNNILNLLRLTALDSVHQQLLQLIKIYIGYNNSLIKSVSKSISYLYIGIIEVQLISVAKVFGIMFCAISH